MNDVQPSPPTRLDAARASLNKAATLLEKPVWRFAAICAAISIAFAIMWVVSVVEIYQERQSDIEERVAADLKRARLQAKLSITNVQIPKEIQALPNLEGDGYMRSLHQTMAQDKTGKLQALVEAWLVETDLDAREKLTDQILFVWAGVDGYSPTSRGPHIDGRKVYFQERFLADPFLQVGIYADPFANAAVELEKGFKMYRDGLTRAFEKHKSKGEKP
jgi:hypothetical protein